MLTKSELLFETEEVAQRLQEFTSRLLPEYQKWLTEIRNNQHSRDLALMYYRPEFFNFQQIRGSLLPFMPNAQYQELTDSKEVEKLQAGVMSSMLNQIEFFKPRNFNRLSVDNQVSELLGMMLGYNWDLVRKDLYPADKMLLNYAVIIGCVDEKLVCSMNIRNQFEQSFSEYKETMLLGAESEKRQQLKARLEGDVYSPFYICKNKCLYYGSDTGKPEVRKSDGESEEKQGFVYYEEYGFPYCCRPNVDARENFLITNQLRLQEGVGFELDVLTQADKLVKQGFPSQFVYNVNLRRRLIDFVNEMFEELKTKGAEQLAIEYTLNGMLHPEFNKLSDKVLRQIVYLPFQKRIQTEYGEFGESESLLIESNNAFSSVGKTEYLKNILTNLANKSNNSTASLQLIKENNDILEYILSGLYYFNSANEFLALLASLRDREKEDSHFNLKLVLERILRVQRILQEEIKSYAKRETWMLTVEERGVSLFLPGGTEYSVELLDSLYELLKSNGANAALMAFDLASREETAELQPNEIDNVYTVYYRYSRLSLLEYNEILIPNAGTKLTDLEILIQLLQMSVDISRLLNLDSKDLTKFSRLLFQDPSMIGYIEKDITPAELQLILLLKSKTTTRFFDRSIATEYKDSAFEITALVESEALKIDNINKYPTSRVFWKALDFCASRDKGTRETIASGAMLTVLPLIQKDLEAASEMSGVELEGLMKSPQIIDPRIKNVSNILTLMSNTIAASNVRITPTIARWLEDRQEPEVVEAKRGLFNRVMQFVIAMSEDYKYSAGYRSWLTLAVQAIIEQSLSERGRAFNFAWEICYIVDRAYIISIYYKLLGQLQEFYPSTYAVLEKYQGVQEIMGWVNEVRARETLAVTQTSGLKMTSNFKLLNIEMEW